MLVENFGGKHEYIPEVQNLSLRDWFAGQALIGLLSCQTLTDETSESFATRAYGLADAMIARRNEGKTSE